MRDINRERLNRERWERQKKGIKDRRREQENRGCNSADCSGLTQTCFTRCGFLWSSLRPTSFSNSPCTQLMALWALLESSAKQLCLWFSHGNTILCWSQALWSNTVISSLMWSGGSYAVEIKQEIKLSFICKFRSRYNTGAVQAGLWLAVLESGPFHCMLCWLCLCHEMFFTAGQVRSLWCPQPEHLSLIRQAFQSCCHGYLERGRPRTKAHYWQLVHLFSLWGFLTTSLPS